MQATIQHAPYAPRLRRWVSIALPVAAIGTFAVGVVLGHIALMAIGAVAICTVWRDVGVRAAANVHRLVAQRGLRLPSQQRAEMTRTRLGRPSTPSEKPPVEPKRETPSEHRAKTPPTSASPTSELVQKMITQGRYALLLRKETASQLADEELAAVLAEMDERMSVVPAGRVLVGEYAERATWGSTPVGQDCAGLEYVEGCYLDRFCVTNEQYQCFVDDCGYEQFQLWPEEALPALFEFVDRTGTPAPASWCDGQFPEGEEHLPVVGISWFEAAAYAKWVGRRLPTDAEWTKAGAWPVEVSPGRVTQRRYPWGDTFEARRAALWSSGQRGPAPVDAFEPGASLGSVYQLIGNVWEWTSSALDATSRVAGGSSDGASMKVLHGGAFNTYFENQATCHFRSGERPLSRRNNIGFRLALSFDVIADQENREVEAAPEEEPEQGSSEVA
jgi:iron(II)-dependent oxidoreductase